MLEPPVRIQDPSRRQRIVLIVAVILLISAALRLYQVAEPATYMFDEVYYAKDAKAIVEGRVGTDGPLHWEAGDEVSWPHPEMGKFAIAVGVLVFGDRSFGWRFPAVVAGLVMLGLVYPIARRLGLPPAWAVIALLFAAADQLGIAQSRIATLDIFVGVWTVLCIYLGLRYVQDGHRRWTLVLCALAGGMAVGTKWSGALALLTVGALLVIAWAGDRRRAARAAGEGGTGQPQTGALMNSSGAPVATASQAPEPFARGLAGALPSALLAAAILVLIPIGVWLLSYTQYFIAGHTWSDFVELQRQALYFNMHLKTVHAYASASYTWIFDYRPVWYYYQGGHTIRGVIAMGNPFLWWLSVAGVIVGVVLAALRRSYLLLPTIIIVALLYVPWFGASRTSFLYYMTPVAPFLAVLAAGLLLVFARTAQLPRYGAWVMAGAAVATAALWDTIAAAAERAVGVAPAMQSFGAGWAAVGVAVVAAAVVLILLLVADTPRVRAARPYIALALAGVVVGIVFAFLPIVLNIPVDSAHFSHMTWFRSWI
jgi:dolichyl-phosphate-mannose-protein mannosyltransferase